MKFKKGISCYQLKVGEVKGNQSLTGRHELFFESRTRREQRKVKVQWRRGKQNSIISLLYTHIHS